ncbi:MAG: AIR synthase-related protein [Nanoarchaeota archaeon]|nr:AIR synthase-related protein [Nanoarchaeota archaeon]
MDRRLDSQEYFSLIRRLGNPLINQFTRVDSQEWDSQIGIGFHYPDVNLPKPPAFQYIDVNLDDEGLIRLSGERYLALNLAEMRTIKDLTKDPIFIQQRIEAGLEERLTDLELEVLAQTWSEHCVHKKFNGKWIYVSDDTDDESGLPNVTDSVFKSIIKPATYAIIADRNIDWLISVFEDNSGVFKINERINGSHKVETHNHPSSLDGFGGANTGVGGVIRDNDSTGIFMDIVSSQWWSIFVNPTSYRDLSLDIQSPLRTLETVVGGVEDYGNKMGIPTMSVNVMFDDSYLKCAVGVGAVAVAPAEINGRKTHLKDIKPGYVAYTLGGKVGKDGIHGATGSSMDLSSDAETSSQVNQSVQIGNPIIEKNVFETQRILAYKGIIAASQDCGAGGWSSALGELAKLLDDFESKRYGIQQRYKYCGIDEQSLVEDRLAGLEGVLELNSVGSPFVEQLKYEIASGEIFNLETNGRGGAEVDLTYVIEKYLGLTSWEKIVSEAQEREVVVVKKERSAELEEICKHNNVEAVKIAEFNNSGMLKVIDQNMTVGLLPVQFLHRGLPQMIIYAHHRPCNYREPEITEKLDLTNTFLELIGRANTQLFDWILTRFDHEVQGGSVVKPLVGKGMGKSDAISYHPVLTEKEVLIESLGNNLLQGDIDAYHMGRNNVVDSIGRIISAGGNLEKICFNGNTLCPKPETDPSVAAKVIRMLKGSADAEIYFGTPRISGKDSTSMERSYISTETSREVRVKARPAIVMSGLGVVEDDSTATTADFKIPGDAVYVIGETRDELGASEFYQMKGFIGRNVPKSDFDEINPRYNKLPNAIKSGLVHSCQYVGRAGLALALANCSIAGDMGLDVNLDNIDNNLGRADKILFSETTGRFVVSVLQSRTREFEEKMQGIYCRQIGHVSSEHGFNVNYQGREVVRTTVPELRAKNKGEIRL